MNERPCFAPKARHFRERVKLRSSEQIREGGPQAKAPCPIVRDGVLYVVAAGEVVDWDGWLSRFDLDAKADAPSCVNVSAKRGESQREGDA